MHSAAHPKVSTRDNQEIYIELKKILIKVKIKIKPSLLPNSSSIFDLFFLFFLAFSTPRLCPLLLFILA